MTQTMADPIESDLQGRVERPSPALLRTLYRKDTEEMQRVGIRQGLWAAVLVYLLFSITDILLIPDAALPAIAARFTIGISTLIMVELQYRENAPAARMDLTCAVALVLAYVGWLFAAITTRHMETISYYLVFGAIFMMSANLFFSFRFQFSILVSGVMLLASLSVLFYLFPHNRIYQLSFGIFHISCFIFTSYVNWKLNRERYHVFLNALEAKMQHKEATERGKALLKLSRTDPLTGLENRRAVDERLRDHWGAWQQQGRRFAVLLIDVDFFKRYNDCYGHQEGDRCLILVADALSKTIEANNASIGRYGGEEFIVITSLDRQEKVEAFAEEIRSTIENLALRHDQRRDGMQIVTVSIGAAFTRHQTGAKLEKIIHEADRALYLAKASGRNCAKLFDPNDPQSSDESENIAALLKIAIEKDLVSLVYQPIQNVKTGRVEALEALMRLNMLDGTSVPPSLFIPVAERTGAILELGRWAIRTVCREYLSNDHTRIVSVNVSPIQLKAPGFATSVAAILGETGIAGNRLAFEITEGLEMEMHSDVLRCISDLKLLGIKIWLDDFGTGFAGLSWLRLIDFDTVKIDRSFLHDCNSPRGMAMLQDIVGLLRNRGPKILVEGVEVEDQMELIRELGIDQVQGFHVGRPVRVESIRTDAPVRQRRLPIQKSA
ncbi:MULTISPECIES: EAL domain-containing protein [unclassified Mesorhizobium]|uniref:putative bifunctional diguanylate cyclase/phosphodiesterase n=1 Tax=unclassified Mesorhizobium TaxID=325217 RepID=UPI0008EF2308|nr:MULTISPECIES: EAL domain-containing protein [unclassified Mesorhizobium]RJG45212.1 EAL domain-containing protein [Mesorhizobium sp. DCY119]SFT91789.1 diguanylate cyclase/phosphodiesterase [Mesorhizobium sp. YR577]